MAFLIIKRFIFIKFALRNNFRKLSLLQISSKKNGLILTTTTFHIWTGGRGFFRKKTAKAVLEKSGWRSESDAHPEAIIVFERKREKRFELRLYKLIYHYGQVAARFKAAVLKTAVQRCTVSSNLTLSANKKGLPKGSPFLLADSVSSLLTVREFDRSNNFC